MSRLEESRRGGLPLLRHADRRPGALHLLQVGLGHWRQLYARRLLPLQPIWAKGNRQRPAIGVTLRRTNGALRR